MCIINPRIDFAFKKLFGSEENKDLLISLINSIVSEQDQVAEIILKNPYNLADYRAGKLTILDIKARSTRGQWFNVEMQISEDLVFDKRAIYYWSKLVTEQLTEGMLFKELHKTISIIILDFNFIPDREEYHNCYKILNAATGKDDKLHDIFEMHYIELRKFRKTFSELTSVLDRWCAFLTRAHELDKNRVPEGLANDPCIVKAITAVDRMFDEEERVIYQDRRLALMEVQNKIASAEEKGIKQGMEKGMQKGMQKGMEIGLEHGLAQGLERGLAQGMEHGLIQGREQALRDALAKLMAEGVPEAEARRWLGL